MEDMSKEEMQKIREKCRIDTYRKSLAAQYGLYSTDDFVEYCDYRGLSEYAHEKVKVSDLSDEEKERYIYRADVTA